MALPSVNDIRAEFASAESGDLNRLIRRYRDDERIGVQSLVQSACRKRRALRAEERRLTGLYDLESSLRDQGATCVAGLDEVGRGALAGPLTTAAVVLPAAPLIHGLDDSKRLTPEQRTEVSLRIRELAIAYSVGHASAAEIDALGLGVALRLAFTRALEGLRLPVDHVLLDGLPLGLAVRETAVVQGDSKVAAIAAASIIAKVERDKMMVEIGTSETRFGFAVNKGYGTPEHLEALRVHGPCSHHRRSFAPCAAQEALFDVAEWQSATDQVSFG